jgi:hypothetical protein
MPSSAKRRGLPRLTTLALGSALLLAATTTHVQVHRVNAIIDPSDSEKKALWKNNNCDGYPGAPEQLIVDWPAFRKDISEKRYPDNIDAIFDTFRKFARS